MIVATLILGVLVNYVLLYYGLGLGALVGVILQLGYYSYYIYKKEDLRRGWVIKTLGILLLCVPFVLRDMYVFKLLTFLALPILFAVYWVSIDFSNLLGSLVPLIEAVFKPIGLLYLLPKEMIDKTFKGKEEVKYVFVGIALALPFLFIVIPLLISSDLILESVTLDFFEGFQISAEWIFRVIFIFFLSTYSFGKLNMGKIQVKEKLNDFKSTKKGTVITNTFLILINILYGVYVFVQIKYLFLNIGVLPEGITYADYAREGFFQLVTVALMNVAVIIIFEYINYSGVRSQRILEGITLILTIVMGVSAFYRMHLYELTYGYTRLRLLVFIFLAILISMMLFLLVYLSLGNKKILNSMVIFLVLSYLVVSWINIDSIVAKANIKRYIEEEKIDMYYLLELSKDAKNEIKQFQEAYPKLFENLDRPFENEEKVPWQEWNFQK